MTIIEFHGEAGRFHNTKIPEKTNINLLIVLLFKWGNDNAFSGQTFWNFQLVSGLFMHDDNYRISWWGRRNPLRNLKRLQKLTETWLKILANVKYTYWDLKIYWILSLSIWNSTTVIILLKIAKISLRQTRNLAELAFF